MALKAYSRVWYQGHQFNARTRQAIWQVEDFLGFPLNILQGSYNTTVSQSGGTHAGGGAIDGAVVAHNDKVIRVARMVGFAMWYRPTLYINGKLYWNKHNHGILVGDRELSYNAKKQVSDFFAHLDGLAGHRYDPTWRPPQFVRFHYPLKVVDLSNIQREAHKKKNWTAHAGVRRMQHALNVKRHEDLVLDGIFGPQTRRAMARYELQVGGDGDGIPGEFSTKHLGLALYKVKP